LLNCHAIYGVDLINKPNLGFSQKRRIGSG